MTAELQLNDPQTLYRRWEASQWSPFSIDLTTDAQQWPALADDVRALLLFVLSSLMVAEERITTKFSGLVSAAGSEEEATFLATQQVDEARHMQFYARFQDEVVADPALIAEHDFLEREGLLSGFVEGYSKIHHDETRHIGYGVWFLRETIAARPEMAGVVRRTLRDLLPAVAESLRPPGDGASGALGVGEEQLRAFALDGLTRRLAIIGVPIETLSA